MEAVAAGSVTGTDRSSSRQPPPRPKLGLPFTCRRSALHAEGVEAAEVVRVGQLMQPHDEVDVAARGEGEALAHAARLLAGGLLEAEDDRVRRSGLDGSALAGAADRPAGQQGPALIP